VVDVVVVVVVVVVVNGAYRVCVVRVWGASSLIHTINVPRRVPESVLPSSEREWS
jgi:hypothetical protein